MIGHCHSLLRTNSTDTGALEAVQRLENKIKIKIKKLIKYLRCMIQTKNHFKKDKYEQEKCIN